MTKTETHLYFWGGPLSNWAYVPGGIKVLDGNRVLNFPTSEHLFMWFKALCFRDLDAMREIESVKTPNLAKSIGRRVKGFDNKTWEIRREGFMLEALREKANSWPEFKELVMNETREFVEASPYDKIWGIGMSEEEAAKENNPENWKGLNLLGKTLGRLRYELLASH